MEKENRKRKSALHASEGVAIELRGEKKGQQINKLEDAYSLLFHSQYAIPLGGKAWYVTRTFESGGKKTQRPEIKTKSARSEIPGLPPILAIQGSTLHIFLWGQGTGNRYTNLPMT